MRKWKIIAAVLAAAIITVDACQQAEAQGAKGYSIETREGQRIRVGALCELRLFGIVQPGRCAVGRQGRLTAITIVSPQGNKASFTITRDEETNTYARFAQDDRVLSTVEA